MLSNRILNTFAKTKKMTEGEVRQIENEVFTKIVMDMFKEQQTEFREREKNGEKVSFEYLLDKYTVDTLTREKVKKILSEK